MCNLAKKGNSCLRPENKGMPKEDLPPSRLLGEILSKKEQGGTVSPMGKKGRGHSCSAEQVLPEKGPPERGAGV